jgi:hypothetical protein
MAATEASFFEFQKRGATYTGCLLATNDDEIGKTRPRPFGLRRKSGHTLFSPSTLGPPKPSGSAVSDRNFARNAVHLSSVNRPQVPIASYSRPLG